MNYAIFLQPALIRGDDRLSEHLSDRASEDIDLTHVSLSDSALAHHQLPILPIIHVCGSMWRVDFAYRWAGKTMIYEGKSIGDTSTV